LEIKGVPACFAVNGKEAIKKFQEKRHDIILMDINMPVMNGYETTAAIRAIEKTAGYRTIIIAMTANAMHGDREESLNAGMDDYIAKPIQLDLLYQLIVKWDQDKAEMTNTTGFENHHDPLQD